MSRELDNYRPQAENELKNILQYWMHNATDPEHGGFVGRIDNQNRVIAGSAKGSVLNSRILWTFAAASRHFNNPRYHRIADRAYDYFINTFIDPEFGGVYWTVDDRGKPLNTKNQLYAVAFAIYGLSEYYRVFNVKKAKDFAGMLFENIDLHGYDIRHGGYFEAFTREWQPMNEWKLSDKDANEKKSMNTHLHLLEAFANLYRVSPSVKLGNRIKELILIFLNRIIGQDNHMVLFFDEYWNMRSDTISFGHDIEAAWLLQDAASLLNDIALQQRVKNISIAMARSAAEGMDADGGLWYEYEKKHRRLIREKHWWPQAEGAVGFFNAWQLSGDEHLLRCSLDIWDFIGKKIIDRRNGEWFWGIRSDGTVMDNEDKVGIWKCPYHNSRACMEIMERISNVQKKNPAAGGAMESDR